MYNIYSVNAIFVLISIYVYDICHISMNMKLWILSNCVYYAQ